MDAEAPQDNHPVLAAGTGYLLGKEKLRLALRLGFNSRSDGDVPGAAAWSAGFGVLLPSLEVDYALVPFGSLGITHRVTLGLKL